MNRISGKIKELVAEVIGDGNMFDEARQEESIAAGSKPALESNMKDVVQDGTPLGSTRLVMRNQSR
jgi:hypothetical protein